jgi:excisionase family DNA binding protein
VSNLKVRDNGTYVYPDYEYHGGMEEPLRPSDDVAGASPTLGELMRRRRYSYSPRMTQAKAGQQLGVNQSTVARWERGVPVGPDHLPGVAEWLGISVADAFLACRVGAAPAPTRGQRGSVGVLPATDPLELLTVRELSDLLKVKKDWIYDHVARGRLPGFKIGGHLRFRRGAIEAYLATQLASGEGVGDTALVSRSRDSVDASPA